MPLTTQPKPDNERKPYRHCHLFDGEGDGVADLGQGVHAALVRPRVPRLRRTDHQRPVVRSDPGPETVYLCQNIFVSKADDTIAGNELVFVICNLIIIILKTSSSYVVVEVFIFPKSLRNSWVFRFLRRLSFPDSISREGQQLKKSICTLHRRINFFKWVDKAGKSGEIFILRMLSGESYPPHAQPYSVK